MRPNRRTMMMGVLIAALSAILILSNLAGCSRSTKPKEVKYNLYVGATHIYTNPEDSSYNRIYIYDADSLTLLDSIWQAHFTEASAVSPDGRWLYVLDHTSQSVPRQLWKFDVLTRQAVWSRSDFGGGGGYAQIRLQQNGDLMVVGNSVLRSDDGSAIRTFTDSMFVMWGPVSGTKVAVIVRGQPLWHGNDSLIRILDVTTGELTGSYSAHISAGYTLQDIRNVRLHPDGRRVLAIGVSGSIYNSWFVIGDVVTGQTLFEYRIDFPYGEIAISHDGKTAVFTDPAVDGGGMPHVIDLQRYTTRTSLSEFDAKGVCFFQGDDRIVIAPWVGPIRVMNVTTLAVDRIIWPTGHDPLNLQPIGGIAIGPRP